MRKNKDYSDIENALFDKANKIESTVNYSGAYRDSKNEKRVKREKKERGFDFPGRQLVAAVLAMVIVGAGTFTGLKMLERVGAQRLAEQGGAGTSQSEKTAEDAPVTDGNRSAADEISVVEPVEYDPDDEYGGKFVYIKSGDKVYQPFVCESSVMAVIDYVAPVFEYGGKLDIVNNVKDRDWTVLSTSFWFPGIQSYDRTFADMDLKLICSWIDRYESDGMYRVTFKVTWDDPNDENAVIYYVDFVIRKTAESEVTETVEPVEYDPKGQNHSKYLYVTSGDKVYQPFIHDKSATVKVGHVLPTFEYNGKISFVNNVKDRDWHILTLYSTDPEKPGGFTYYTYSDGSIEDITLTEPGTYFFYAEVTWDDPDDENAVIYFVEFYITKGTESAVFEDVVKFDIDYTNYDDDFDDWEQIETPKGLLYKLRLTRKLKCEAAKALGYNIYMYDATVEFDFPRLTPWIFDENGEFMFDFQQGSDVWYAGKTPTGHPTFFYVKRHALTSNGWTYADLYAYDTVKKENTLIISVGPKGLHSRSNLRVFGDISYNEETKELKVNFYEDNTNIWNPEDKATWPEPFAAEQIKWNGNKYVVEGIEAVRIPTEPGNETETGPETDDEELIEQIEAEAEGRLYVVSGDTKEYPPLISATISGDDGQKRIETGNDMTEIEYAEPFEIRNGIRTMMYINGIDVTVATIDQNIEALLSFLHVIYKNITEEQLIPVRISVHWNDDNIYEYGFLLRMIPYNGSDTQTETEMVEVTPSGYAKFTLAAGKNKIAPFEYSEWSLNERDRVNVTYNSVPDTVPVLNLYGLGEYGALFCSYDREAVSQYKTYLDYFGGGTLVYDSPEGAISYAKSMLNLPGASNVFYIETVFKKNDGSDRYISYIYAVSGGEPDCYPYSGHGDGGAKLKVADGNGRYAPRAERFNTSTYEPDNRGVARFNEVGLPYYKAPEVTLDNGLLFEYTDGYKISYAVAFPDPGFIGKREELESSDANEITEWLKNLPWNEFYAAVVMTGEDGELSYGGKDYREAYVFKVINTGEKQVISVDHSTQIAQLQSWLSQRMWYGMTSDDLVRGAGSLSDNGISFKTRFLADDHSQYNVEEDYTFVAYRSEHYDVIFRPKNEQPYVLLEARVIMREGAEFELPFGITLDMSAEEALKALGYTEEQITAMDGYAHSGDYKLRYDDRSLIITYHCNGACLGIELGSDPQMYMETAG